MVNFISHNLVNMKEQIRLLTFLRSNKFILYVAIFTVIFLAPNTYYVFHMFSVLLPPYREIASAGVALIVAASIMIYTLRKNYKVAKYYSFFEITISAYYYIVMIGWDWALIPALSFTLMLPISVYHYTREIDVNPDFDAMNEYLDKEVKERPTNYLEKNR